MAWGGQEIRIVTELKALPKMGWRVQLWAPKYSEIFQRSKRSQIPTEAVSFRGPLDVLSILNLRRLIRERQADLIVTHSSIDSWVVGWATRSLTPRPRIVRTRHLSTPVRNFFPYRWFTDAICTTSEDIREGFLSAGIEAQKVTCIATGVDRARFRPNPAMKETVRRNYHLPLDRPVVGGVFVIRSWKGIYDFVKIAAATPAAHFVVAGDGPSRAAMEGAASQAGLAGRMTFLGHVEPVEEIFWALDVFLFPSTANEGIPQALLQAQASGVPAVVSDLASIREAAPHAIMCPAGDVAKFTSAVGELIRDPDRAAAVSTAGQAAAERFDQARILPRIDEFYRGLIGSQLCPDHGRSASTIALDGRDSAA